MTTVGYSPSLLLRTYVAALSRRERKKAAKKQSKECPISARSEKNQASSILVFPMDATIVGAAAAASSSSLNDTVVMNNSFVNDITLYFLVKIVTSLDDLLWLSPFLAIASSSGSSTVGDTTTAEGDVDTSITSSTGRRHVFIIYICICLLISMSALLFSWIANEGLTLLLLNRNDENGEYDSDEVGRILNIVGGLCIALFAFLEWKNNDDSEDDEEEGGDTDGASSPQEITAVHDMKSSNITHSSSTTGTRGDGRQPTETTSLLEKGLATYQNSSLQGEGLDEDDNERSNHYHHHHNRRRQKHVLIDLFVVGIFGQLDTLAIFFSVLVSQKTPVRIIPVLVGSLLAAFVIITIAYFITLLKPLTQCLQRIPLWILLSVIAIYVILQGVI